MGWSCATCTLWNETDDYLACEACMAPRAPAEEEAAAEPARKKVRREEEEAAAPAARRVEVEAWKCLHDFEGAPEETDDEGEDAATVTISGGGAAVRVVGLGDLHRHHNDRSIFVGEGESRRRVTLAEWFAVAAPADVGLCVFAGDLGLEQNDELARESGRGVDRRARGIRETGREKEEASVAEWAALFRGITAARPGCHVVCIGGNHDGLLCEDEACASCAVLDAMPFERTERRRPWGATAREAVDAVERALVGGSRFVHVLRDSFVDVSVPLVGGGRGSVRVLGSPLTPRVAHGAGEPCLAAHNTLHPRDAGATHDRWARLLAHADRPSVLCVHGPPFGILDIVGRDRRVGCEQLARAMEGKSAVALCVFGHVHAKQHAFEPPGGPRLCVSRRHPRTLFCNAASETGTAQITGFRLADKSGKYDDVPMLRPPAVLEVPLRGFDDAGGYWDPRV